VVSEDHLTADQAREAAERLLADRADLGDEVLSLMTPLSDDSLDAIADALRDQSKDLTLTEERRAVATVLRIAFLNAGDVFIATEDQGMAVDRLSKERDDARKEAEQLARALLARDAEVRELRAEVDRLRAGLIEAHKRRQHWVDLTISAENIADERKERITALTEALRDAASLARSYDRVVDAEEWEAIADGQASEGTP